MIKTESRHIADFNRALADLVPHHRLAPPLLSKTVVHEMWKMHQETGVVTFPFGREMVYEPATSYMVTEETLCAVMHLLLLGEAYVYYVQQDFCLILLPCLVWFVPRRMCT